MRAHGHRALEQAKPSGSLAVHLYVRHKPNLYHRERRLLDEIHR